MDIFSKFKKLFPLLGFALVFLIIIAAFFSVGKTAYYTVTKSQAMVYNSALAAAASTGAEVSTTSQSYASFERDFLGAPAKGKAIVVDLGSMKLYLYNNGTEVSEIPILTKPARGSIWDVPNGHYEVGDKEASHYSRFADAEMPYSVQFFGNYFIHGVPYLEKGKKQVSLAGKGCISLTDDDAKKVYDFADRQTEVLVYGSGNNGVPSIQSSSYIIKKSINFVPVTAGAYLIADADTGEIIVQHNMNEVYPIASISKLITALVSLDLLNQSDTITVSATAMEAYGSAGQLHTGEKLKVSTMLYPLLLESSNRAAEALAEKGGRPYFLQKMNEKAQELGMTQTSFEDPSGLSPHNVSTAADLFKLATYIYHSKRFLFDLTRERNHIEDGYNWTNHNNLISMNYYIGGKNGYTDEADRTFLALFSVPLSEFENRTIVLALLKSDDRTKDTNNLINYVVRNVSFMGNQKNLTASAGLF